MKSAILSGLAAIGAMVAATPAMAALDEPVPTTNYINFGGIDWAWASPCSPDGCFEGTEIDLSYQATQGWRVATAADLASGPAPSDFLSASGGVICASAWFTAYYTHCDYGDAEAGGIWNAAAPNGQEANSETWVIRDGQGGGTVPEAATWAMMLAGFGLMGVALRRRRPAVA